ncbi:hypothetical protein [Parafrankia irregularis]|nr:hypothetical protein [Parafrankia irregularis]
MGPQEIVEEALAAWFDRHERRQRGKSASISASGNAGYSAIAAEGLT